MMHDEQPLSSTEPAAQGAPPMQTGSRAEAAARTQPPSPPAADRTAINPEALLIAYEELQVQQEELLAARTLLEAERSRYQDLVDFALDGYLVTDLNGRILEANRNAATLFNIAHEHLIGKPLLVFVAAEDRRSYRVQLGRLRRGEPVEEWELALQPRQGAPLPATLTIASIKDRQDRVVGLRWLVRDITARKQGETKLQERTRQQAALAELGQHALASLDLTTVLDRAVTLISQTLRIEMAKVLELLPDRKALLLRTGVGWHDGLVGQATVGTERNSQAGYTLLSDGPVVVEDLRREQRFSGPPLLHEHRVISGMSVVIHGQHGPFGVLGAHTTQQRLFTHDDVTFLQGIANILGLAIDRHRTQEEQASLRAREAAEQAARVAAEHLAAERRAMLGHITDGVIIADRMGCITFLNDAARRLIGEAEADTLTGRPVEALPWLTSTGAPYPREDRPLVRALDQGALVRNADIRIQRNDGRQIAVRGSAAPVIAEDGSQIGAVLTLHDMTAQQELERQKDEFLAHVSHDLRTPLTAIKASIGIVLANEPAAMPPALHRLFLNIDLATDRMITLVSDLLDLTRLQLGGLQLQRGRCDLRALARRTARTVEPLAAAQDQQIILDLPSEPVPAVVDTGRLERAVQNLLVNAQQHSAPGGIIRLTLAADQGAAVLAVADEGPGIPLEEQERIFERFYRSEADRNGQGSGLGLPIARALIELHGGQLSVESVPGAGATFRIALPRCLPPDEQMEHSG